MHRRYLVCKNKEDLAMERHGTGKEGAAKRGIYLWEEAGAVTTNVINSKRHRDGPSNQRIMTLSGSMRKIIGATRDASIVCYCKFQILLLGRYEGWQLFLSATRRTCHQTLPGSLLSTHST